MSKLNLDRDKIDLCRKLAKEIVSPIQKLITEHSTFSVERTVLRLLGVDAAMEGAKATATEAQQGRYPLVNGVIEKIGPERLARGAAYWLGRAMVANPRSTPLQVAQGIVEGKIDLNKLPEAGFDQIHSCIEEVALSRLNAIKEKRATQEKLSRKLRLKKPLLYVIVATGNIYEDVVQAKSAAKMGADIIAVIRSTAQSLLDYVPTGATTEGFGGTYATQENFKIMRKALDEVGQELGRYIGLTNYSSGLCMPEIAAMAAMEGLDYLLNDAMYGILFRDINMKRTLVDQHFSRLICSFAGITIQTGEDNYLTTAESHKFWHQVLTSHFINEEFAKQAHLTEDKIALGHAFEMDPFIEDSILFEIGQAQLVREIFHRSPIKYMPPTKHKQGDIFFSQLYDGIFNLTGVLTNQSIILLGMPTEAIHNPFMQDRFISLKNASYIFNGAKNLGSEINFQANGKIVRRARHVLDETSRLLRKVKLLGLMGAIERGLFANISRGRNSGKGQEGVFERESRYYNPFFELLSPHATLSRRPRFTPSEQRYDRNARGRGDGRRDDRRRDYRREDRRENQGDNRRRGGGNREQLSRRPLQEPPKPAVEAQSSPEQEKAKKRNFQPVVYRPPRQSAPESEEKPPEVSEESSSLAPTEPIIAPQEPTAEDFATKRNPEETVPDFSEGDGVEAEEK